MADVRLKPGRERSVLAGHPWVFSGALEDLPADLAPGSPVRLLTCDGRPVARGYANPGCSIAVRILTTRDEPVDRDFLARRIREAAATRSAFPAGDTSAWRIVNGEGDGLPGFVVDRYGETVVLQVLTAGAERLREPLVAALRDELAVEHVYEKSTGSVRRAEGLSDRQGWLAGGVPLPLTVRENGLRLLADPAAGQKTGLFLDQRDNHALVRTMAAGLRVLDVFAYTGAFALHAAAGGARRVVAVERSEPALALARRNAAANGLAADAVEWVRADARSWLGRGGETFDLVVVDPPALARHRAEVPRASRACRELNRAALRRLASPGWLATFTCSQHIPRELFLRLVATAIADERREACAVRHLGAGTDHPFPPAQPEAEYLKGLLVRVR